RLSFLARLRTRDAAHQPAVRLAVEGRLADGSPIYTYSQTLGMSVDSATLRPQGTSARTLPAQWVRGSEGEFLFHLTNLPAGTEGQISVGIDLLGPGEVWIDDVELYA